MPDEFADFVITGKTQSKDEYTYGGLNRVSGKKKRKNRKRKRGQQAAAPVKKVEQVREEEEDVPVPERDVFVMKRWANFLKELEIEVPGKVKELDAALDAVQAKLTEYETESAQIRDEAV